MLKKIDFSRKRASKNLDKRNLQYTKKKRKIQNKELIPILTNENNIIIYIDETSIDERLIPLYGYSKKG